MSNPTDAPPNKVVEKIYMALEDADLQISDEKKIEYGFQIRLTNGSIINIYTTGKILVQGKEVNRIKKILNLPTHK